MKPVDFTAIYQIDLSRYKRTTGDVGTQIRKEATIRIPTDKSQPNLYEHYVNRVVKETSAVHPPAKEDQLVKQNI